MPMPAMTTEAELVEHMRLSGAPASMIASAVQLRRELLMKSPEERRRLADEYWAAAPSRLAHLNRLFEELASALRAEMERFYGLS